jgi:hypothetical protein
MQIRTIVGPIGQLLIGLPTMCFYLGSEQKYELMVIFPGQ